MRHYFYDARNRRCIMTTINHPIITLLQKKDKNQIERKHFHQQRVHIVCGLPADTDTMATSSLTILNIVLG